VIFAWFVMACFIPSDGKACIHWSKNILYSGVHSIVTCAHCAVNGDVVLDTVADKGTVDVIMFKPRLNCFFIC
jgi:hypothetical protein